MKKTYKTFVVEDNRTEGLLLQLALSEISHLEVKMFPTAQSLLEHLVQKPAIVIVDLNLPDMNGLDLIKIIREQYPKVRIVVVSAQRDMDMLAKVQAMGIYNYLVKSEDCLVYLHKVIEELLIILEYQQTFNTQ
jgi:two-component system chemotaxis response regulator CheY